MQTDRQRDRETGRRADRETEGRQTDREWNGLVFWPRGSCYCDWRMRCKLIKNKRLATWAACKIISRLFWQTYGTHTHTHTHVAKAGSTGRSDNCGPRKLFIITVCEYSCPKLLPSSRAEIQFSDKRTSKQLQHILRQHAECVWVQETCQVSGKSGKEWGKCWSAI